MKNNIDRRKFLSVLGVTTLGAGVIADPLHGFSNSTVSNLLKDTPTDIKITNVKTFRISRAIITKIESNIGISGWGESSSNSSKIVEAFIHDKMKHVVIGQDPFNIEYLWDRLFWGEHDLGPAGALPYSVAGIDLALWDLIGKVLNRPVYQLIGGSYRKEMLAYCGIPLNGGKIPVEEGIERALKVVDLGFKVVKLRMQIREYNLDPIPDPTIKYYTAIRKALPDNIELFVDPNEGYTAARAIQIGKELQSMGMKYYESPCPLENHRDTAEVVDALDIPVMAGEKCYTRWQIRDLILQANPDIIQPNVIKAGGITEVKKIATIGQTFFKALVPHNTKPTLGTAAAMHVMASISNAGPFIEYAELDTYKEVMSVFDTHVKFIDGKMKVPEEPGLGLAINEERLSKLAR